MDQIDYQSVIPVLSSKIEIHPFEKDKYLIFEPILNKKILINSLTKKLISLVDGKKSVTDLSHSLNGYGIQANEDVIFKTLQGLEDYGITVSDKVLSKKKTADYLWLSIELVKEKYVSHVSHLLGFLFAPKIFWSLFVSMSFILIGIFIKNLTWHAIYDQIEIDLFLPLGAVFFVSLLLHELGHTTACRFFGARHGSIGFAFYLLTPVFYADVSDAWKLPSKQRVIIDLAGVFMEILLSFLLTVVSLLIKDPTLLLIGFLIIINTIKNLNPFLRFDAYWVLTDILNIPNLRQRSNVLFKSAMTRFFKKSDGPKFLWKDYILIAYAFISFLLVIIFITVMIVYNNNSVLYFPRTLIVKVHEVILNGKALPFSWYKSTLATIAMPLSFYILLSTILIRGGTKAIKKLLNY